MKHLKEIVQADLKENGVEHMQDVLQYGCQSGMVSELIYYADTLKFFADHKEEINELLKEAVEMCGESAADVFGDKFDNEDVLCLEANNQNLLAWFGYEETLRQVMQEEG